MSPILVLTNCDSREEAESIADELLEKQLAAAVQIVGPTVSRYRWQGKIQKQEEWLVIVKSVDHSEKSVIATIRSLHSYELPGITTIAVDGGDAQYLQWILDNSTP